jgi:hypothetical protein
MIEERGWLGIPYAAYAAGCLALAVVWVVVWPSGKAAGLDAPWLLALRWGHAIAWALLGLMCLSKAFRVDVLVGPLGLAAGAVYVLFVVSLVQAG